MKQRMHPGARRAAWLFVIAGVAFARDASALSRPMTLDEVVDASEQIFVATCEDKDVAWRGGNIVTSYNLRPTEVWKGELPSTPSGTVVVEQLGGSIETDKISLGQHFTASVELTPGEEVLLFTRAAKSDPRLEAAGKVPVFSAGTLQVVGQYNGRYSILTDREEGGKYLVRIGLDQRGIIPSDRSVRGYLNVQSRIMEAKLRREARAAASAAPAPSAAADDDATAPASRPDEGVEADRVLELLRSSGAAADSLREAARAAAEETDSGPRKTIRDFESLATIRAYVTNRVAGAAR